MYSVVLRQENAELPGYADIVLLGKGKAWRLILAAKTIINVHDKPVKKIKYTPQGKIFIAGGVMFVPASVLKAVALVKENMVRVTDQAGQVLLWEVQSCQNI